MGDDFLRKLAVVAVMLLAFSFLMEKGSVHFFEGKKVMQDKTAKQSKVLQQSNGVSQPGEQILKPTMDWHSYAFCNDISIADVEKAGSTFYQWIDENGQLQVSDKKPDGVKAIRKQGASSKQKFKLIINDKDQALDKKSRDYLRIALKRVYTAYAEFLPRDKLKSAEVNIFVFSNWNDYENHAKSILPVVHKLTDGFYYKPVNQAVVFYRNDKQVIRTLVHEAVHLINATVLGVTPPWLNEGLAMYYEDMEIFGQAAVIKRHDYMLRFLQENQVKLATLVNAEAMQWKGQYSHAFYANSWSLVYFMMDDQQRKNWMKEYLVAIADNYCKPINHNAWIEQRAGGYGKLDEVWLEWQQAGHGKVSHQF